MVKMRSRPPEIMRKTKTARARVKMRGRDGWIFFSPTKGTYQSRKMRKKRIKQVKTSSPIKILFLGLTSKVTSQRKMSNAKTQSSKEIQISNIKNFHKKVLPLNYFDIPLTFEL